MEETKLEKYPVWACYRYGIKDFFNRNFKYGYARCKILAETEKSYKIELTQCTNRKNPGDQLWVEKKSICYIGHRNIVSGHCDLYPTMSTMPIELCLSCTNPATCYNRGRIIQDNGFDKIK